MHRGRWPTIVVAPALVAGVVLAGPSAWAADAPAQPAPVAVGDSARTTLDVPTTIDVLANDTVGIPVGLTVPAAGHAGAPSHGQVSATDVAVPGGTRPALLYQPAAGWSGTDSFRYTVTDPAGTASATVSVTVERAAPHAVDDVAQVMSGSVVRIAVLDNDTEPHGRPLHVVDVGPAQHGSAAVVESGGALTYTPSPGWVGDDVMSYTIAADSGPTSSAQVRVTTLPAPPARTVLLNAPASIPVLRSTSLLGSVAPAGGVAVVAVQRETAAGWVTVAVPVLGPTGTFAMAWTPAQPGAVRWRAVAQWADGTSAVSAPATSTALARADAVVSSALGRAAVPYSYRLGCPVPPSKLRKLSINYWDYRGVIRRGNLVVAVSAVGAVQGALTAAFDARFRIKMMTPVDAFYRRGRATPTASDIVSMTAGNTSAFNCRRVTGSRYRISQHSYGNAIDVNTFENPYVTASRVYPAAAARSYYALRARHLGDVGVITARSAIARAFAVRHWLWGARWSRPDYQHFSSNGG